MPAEAAGIDLKLDKQNPVKHPIKSAVSSQKDKSFEAFVINLLGKRFEKLAVANEKDCIRVIHNGWLDKQV